MAAVGHSGGAYAATFIGETPGGNREDSEPHGHSG